MRPRIGASPNSSKFPITNIHRRPNVLVLHFPFDLECLTAGLDPDTANSAAVVAPPEPQLSDGLFLLPAQLDLFAVIRVAFRADHAGRVSVAVVELDAGHARCQIGHQLAMIPLVVWKCCVRNVDDDLLPSDQVSMPVM